MHNPVEGCSVLGILMPHNLSGTESKGLFTPLNEANVSVADLKNAKQFGSTPSLSPVIIFGLLRNADTAFAVDVRGHLSEVCFRNVLPEFQVVIPLEVRCLCAHHS